MSAQRDPVLHPLERECGCPECRQSGESHGPTCGCRACHPNGTFFEDPAMPDGYCQVGVYVARLEAREDHLLHGICDALNMLRRTEGAGPAILRALLKGTAHENHEDKP